MIPDPIVTTDHPIANCLDLRAMLGDYRDPENRRFKFEMDPSWDVQSEGKEIERAWLTRIPCRKGCIFPWGDVSVEGDGEQRLAAYCGKLEPVRIKLAEVPGAVIEQGWAKVPKGLRKEDVEIIISFPVSSFETVCEILGPKMTRAFTDEWREARVATLQASKPQPEGPDRGLESTNAPSDGGDIDRTGEHA